MINSSIGIVILSLLFLFSQKDSKYFFYYILTTTIVIILSLVDYSEHLTITQNEGIQLLSSVYNNNQMTVTNLKVTGTLDTTQATTNAGNINASTVTTSGKIIANGGMTSKDTITVDKRNSTWGPNISIIAPKNEDAYVSWYANDGTTRTAFDKGSYRLSTRGLVMDANGDVNFNTNNLKQSGNRVMYENSGIAIQSSRGGFLSDQGGWKGRPGESGCWETMYLRMPDLGRKCCGC